MYPTYFFRFSLSPLMQLVLQVTLSYLKSINAFDATRVECQILDVKCQMSNVRCQKVKLLSEYTSRVSPVIFG